jgi:hypothetical protein
MRRRHAIFLGFLAATIALIAPGASQLGTGAPAPPLNRDANAKLEELKKKLPDIVADWSDREETGNAWFSRIRQISGEEAKATFVLKEAGKPREILTVFLRFYNGIWVTTHYQASWAGDLKLHRAAHILLFKIDDAAEK